jgi:tripartite-type tricarboxylate transporter receptor subunit TctC
MRKLFWISAFFAAAMFAAPSAFAQNYPDQPLRFIVPYNAGGSYDTIARLVGQKLTDLWHQQVVIENRPGAGSLLGTEVASRAAPDGYTIVMFGNNHAVLPSVHKSATFNVEKDFIPVSLVATISDVLLVTPSLPVHSVQELIKLAKEKPGQLNFGSGGNGSITHLGMEIFKLEAGVDLVHVPYKAGVPATLDLIAGQTQVGLLNVLSARPQVESKKLRAIAIASKQRSPLLPDVVTMTEAGLPRYELEEWYGIAVPAGVPQEIVGKLNGAIAKVMADPELRARLTAQGAVPVTGTPKEFADLLKAEIDKYAKAVKAAGIKAR